MARARSLIPLLFFSFLIVYISLIGGAEGGGSIGVNYGRVANNLPSAVKVVELLKSQRIDRVKLYDTDPAVLRALAGSGVKVTVALPNELLSSVARRPSFAITWVQKNIQPYYPGTQIQAIAVGNEVFVDPRNLTTFLVPAMANLHDALLRLNLHSDIKLSSPLALTCLRSSYPPSAGAFRSELLEPVIKPMLRLVSRTGSYLMVNAYPFFAYEANADVISLDYALFRSNPGVVDAGSGLRYFSLFDAQIDAVYAALSAAGFGDVKLVVTETGWPSKGEKDEKFASVANAAAYNGNLVRRVLAGGGGTPLRPHAEMDVYLFALFNENQKPGPASERNYGLFYPNEEKVYEIPLTPEAAKRKMPDPQPAEKGGSGGQDKGDVHKSGSGRTWCVAKSEVGKQKLQQALDFACGEGGADCKAIQPGADCYDPNTLEAHASFAFNAYYQKNARAIGTCYFGGAASVIDQQPKFGKCAFPTGG